MNERVWIRGANWRQLSKLYASTETKYSRGQHETHGSGKHSNLASLSSEVTLRPATLSDEGHVSLRRSIEHN